METIFKILFNPFTLFVIGFVILLGAVISPYEVKFDESDEDPES